MFLSVHHMVCRYFVMRDTIERPEVVEAGTLRLIGTEEENIYRNFKELLEDPAAYEKMSHACNQSLWR